MKVTPLKYRQKISERFQTLFRNVTNTKDESLHPDKEYRRIVDDEIGRRCLHSHVKLEAKLTPGKKKLGIKKLSLPFLPVFLIFTLVLSLFLFASFVPSVNATVITRVQGNCRGTGTSSPVTVTMTSTPVSGDVEIAVIDFLSNSASPSVSLSQTGVSWSKQVSVNETGGSGYSGYVSIWLGVVSSGASTSVSVSFSGSISAGAVVDICEYSGIATSGYLDKTASNKGESASSDTGTTATTSQANELWIGGAGSAQSSQSTPTNGFTLLDGAEYNGYVCVAYLEKIVSATGTADSGTTLSSSNYWTDCIATFKARLYNLNLRVMDWGLTTGIQGAYVYENSSVKTSNVNGWANWTQLYGTCVYIEVKYYGFWVNGTFSVSLTSNQTINVRCKLYDITIKTVESLQNALLAGVNVTAFNATSGGTEIATGKTGNGGTVQFNDLPNNTLTFICRAKSDWSLVIQNTTINVNSVGNGGSSTITCTKNALTAQASYSIPTVKVHFILSSTGNPSLEWMYLSEASQEEAK